MNKYRYGIVSAILSAALLSVSACAASESCNMDNAVKVSFNGDTVSVSGPGGGIETEGAAVSVTKAGTYVFSGSCDDGTITVKKEVEGVTLVLDGLTLTSKKTSPITLSKGSKAKIIAADGSKNTVSDTAGANDENAAVKVKSGAELEFGGTGELNVKGNVKNGIKGAAEAKVTVRDITINIEAPDDGLSSDDEVKVDSGNVKITAGGDGIKASPDIGDAENPDTKSKGTVTISGGNFDITSVCDGVQADGGLSVTGGTVNIIANGGSTTKLSDDADSCKGLKSDKLISISGGTFNIDSADDAIHSDMDVNVTGGDFTVAAGDDGIHADGSVVIGTEGVESEEWPKINVTTSYESIEGKKITVYGGDIDVKATDDGFNAANSDLGMHSDEFELNIHGGNVYINAGSDGLDSNNDITMDGGTVEVYGANRGMDCAIDYDGTFTLNGGTLLGAGTSPSAGTQAYVIAGSENRQFTAPADWNGENGERPVPPDWNNENGERPALPDWNGENGERPVPPDWNNENGERPVLPDGGGRPGFGGGLGENKPDGGNMTDLESALGIKEGSEIVIKDASGKVLYTAKALGPMSNVIFSSPDVKEGEPYTVYVDGESAGTSEAKLGTAKANQGMGAGPQKQEGQQEGNGDGILSAFSDVAANDWFADAVRFVLRSGIMNGKTDSVFAPADPVTRAMFATVLYRLSGNNEKVSESGFTDVPGDAYYADAVAWAAKKGIVTGSDNGKFSPSVNITREQLAAMLYRASGDGAEVPDDSLSKYADAGSVSEYAKKAVNWCVSKGILSGKASDTIDPEGTATRAEAAEMLLRYAQLNINNL